MPNTSCILAVYQTKMKEKLFKPTFSVAVIHLTHSIYVRGC